MNMGGTGNNSQNLGKWSVTIIMGFFTWAALLAPMFMFALKVEKGSYWEVLSVCLCVYSCVEKFVEREEEINCSFVWIRKEKVLQFLRCKGEDLSESFGAQKSGPYPGITRRGSMCDKVCDMTRRFQAHGCWAMQADQEMWWQGGAVGAPEVCVLPLAEYYSCVMHSNALEIICHLCCF